MKIPEIILKTQKPAIYEKGTAFMWTDKYISQQLLKVHLNEDVDLASRKKSNIKKTANWILETQKEKKKLNILDLGCGPGLYTEIFAEKGHHVSGVDISESSIEHAKKSAKEKGLNIHYLCKNYLELDLGENKYDLIIIIFTDLGVLIPEERNLLINKIYRALKKGGTFIFDVLNDNELENKTSPKTWEASKGGFWKASPYLALSESFFYKEEKVILFQHNIIDDNDNLETYRFWTHFFSQNDVRKMLEDYNYSLVDIRDDILPKGDIWSGDNVIFTIASK
jgi:2-polyprenyl-3-methyl-5-hydroxy-6-metoxy-1,4-benzoquinol methylase